MWLMTDYYNEAVLLVEKKLVLHATNAFACEMPEPWNMYKIFYERQDEG